MLDLPASFEHRSVCLDWYDGKNSAMYKVWHLKKFNPRYLLSEVRSCLHHLQPSLAKVEEPRLKSLERWALDMIDRESAEVAIKRAVTRAKRMSMSMDDIYFVALNHYNSIGEPK